MATTLARLAVDLYANTSRLETGMKKASGLLDSFSRKVEQSAAMSNRKFNTLNQSMFSASNIVRGLAVEFGSLGAVIGSALSVSKVVQYSDAWKSLSARMEVAAGDFADVAQVQEELFKIAQKNSAPLADVIDAYSRLSLSLTDVQKRQFDLTQVTDLLSKTLLVSGTNAAGAATFLQQFGQAASSDFKAVGQEIQTFSDQNAFFMKVLKENIDTGGRSLKEFAADGELSTELVINALLKGLPKIEEASAKIPTTVGRALTQLDNAFLKLIGQSDAVNGSTTLVAGGILKIAENLGILAKTVGLVAVAFGARFVPVILAAGAKMGALALSTFVTNGNLARTAGIGFAASIGLTAAAGATGLLTKAMALLGGPIGLIVTATAAVLLFGDEIINAAKKVPILGDALNVVFFNADSLASGLALSIKSVFQGLVQTVRKYVADIVYMYQNAYNFIAGSAAGKLFGLSEIKIDPETARLAGTSYGQAFNEGVEMEVDKFAAKNFAPKVGKIKPPIEPQISQSSIEDVEKKLKGGSKSLKSQTKELEKQKKAVDELERSYEELGRSFGTAFEDAIIGGKKFSDVLKSLAEDVQRFFFRKQVTPVLEGIASEGLSFFRNAFSGAPSFDDAYDLTSGFSFATGIQKVPYDMTARIHKGEAIVPAQQAKGLGGGDVVVNITNNAGAEISTSQTQTANGMELNVMIDQAVANNIGRKGSKTNQALNAFSSRSLVKR